jgi:hypothetical protein
VQYTDAGGIIAYFITDRAGGMIAYPLIDRVLGTGGNHFVSRVSAGHRGSSDVP